MITYDISTRRARGGAKLAACFLGLLACMQGHAANVDVPPDPGFEVSVIAADAIVEVEIVAGGPFRAVALVKKTLKGAAPDVIELEGFNSFNWDTVHHGLQSGVRCILFLSKTERADVFAPLTPAAPRFSATAEGVMIAFGDPPVRFPVKAAALEQGLSLLIEKNSTGKIPPGADAYLHGLWDLGEIEARCLAVEMAGALRAEHALPMLLEASNDKILRFRLRAIEALGKIGTPQALGAVRALLRDEKKSVAREAARVLVLLHDGDSIPALLDWVRKNVAVAGKPAGSGSSDSDQTKAESVAMDVMALARAGGALEDVSKVARVLLEIARAPNEKLAGEALDLCVLLAPLDTVPTLIELAQDRLYEPRERAFSALRRVALTPVRDVEEFQAWWKNAANKFNEDARRDAAEAAGRALARAEDYDERSKLLESLRRLPPGIALVTSAPFLMNPKALNYFSDDDLAAWNSPLAVPFLLERLGRESATTRRSALEALVQLCGRNSRLAEKCWPLIRAHLTEHDSGIRRAAQNAVGTLSRSDGVDALLDAIDLRGIYEPQDCGKALYMLTARTMGFAINEPIQDQIEARKHFRGWWAGARSAFHPVAVSTPSNPFVLFPNEVAKLRVLGDLDDAARGAKLEATALSEDSVSSEVAFGLLMNERSADDPFWKKLIGQSRWRDRARGLVGSLGSTVQIADLAKRIAAKSDAETPLTRSVILLSLAASSESPDSKGAGAKAVVKWLKSSGVADSHPMKRLAVISLGLADKEPESLKFLTHIVDAAMKADAPDLDAPKSDEPNGATALLRPAVTALCARADSNAALLSLLEESSEPQLRETAARTLSLRREHAAVAGIAKTLEKADRYTWQEIAGALEPLLSADDGPVLCQLLDGTKSSTRAAAAWMMTRNLKLGNDARTRAALIAALTDDSNLVRYYAAEALGLRKTKSALDALVKMLDDLDDDVRAAAVQAIGEIGDTDACILASKAAANQFRVDTRWMKALAISGNLKWLADIMKLANSNLYPEQRAGLEALSASDTPAAQDRLLKTFRNDDEPQQTVAADLLAERGDASLRLLAQDLASTDKAARGRTIHLLARIHSTRALSALQTALKSETDPGLKTVIAWAIEKASQKL